MKQGIEICGIKINVGKSEIVSSESVNVIARKRKYESELEYILTKTTDKGEALLPTSLIEEELTEARRG